MRFTTHNTTSTFTKVSHQKQVNTPVVAVNHALVTRNKVQEGVREEGMRRVLKKRKGGIGIAGARARMRMTSAGEGLLVEDWKGRGYGDKRIGVS